MAATVLATSLAAVPCQPACTAAITCFSGSNSRIGAQSATRDADHDAGLVGDDGIAFQGEKMADILIGFVDHQDVAAMHLADGDQRLLGNAEGACQQVAVALHVVRLIQGVGPQIERVVGGA